MKKRTIAPMIISLISGGMIIFAVTLMLTLGFKDNQIQAYTLLFVSGLLIICGGLLSYFYNDRLSALVILCFTILGFIGLRMFYTHPILENKLNYDGISLCQNNGFVQEVKHFHLHLIPKYKNSKKLSVEEVYKIICEN